MGGYTYVLIMNTNQRWVLDLDVVFVEVCVVVGVCVMECDGV